MTEPVVFALDKVPGQATAVRVAITSFHAGVNQFYPLGDDENGLRLAEAYKDRLREVLGLIFGPPASPVAPALGAAHERSNRILQLAGIVPEQATVEQRKLADIYAIKGMAIDVAASDMRRSLKC